jgi:hypothetical protein
MPPKPWRLRGTNSQPFPLVVFGGAVATIAGLTASVTPRKEDDGTPDAAASDKSEPTYNLRAHIMPGSGLDDEQKRSIALCRRQSWIRAFQLGPALALWGYAGCIIADSLRPKPLPRGSRFAVPMSACVVGMTVGAYLGGREGKPFMNAALWARQVEGAHTRRGER